MLAFKELRLLNIAHTMLGRHSDIRTGLLHFGTQTLRAFCRLRDHNLGITASVCWVTVFAPRYPHIAERYRRCAPGNQPLAGDPTSPAVIDSDNQLLLQTRVFMIMSSKADVTGNLFSYFMCHRGVLEDLTSTPLGFQGVRVFWPAL